MTAPPASAPEAEGEAATLGTLAKKFFFDEAGEDKAEYALIAAMVALSLIATRKTLGNRVSNEFKTIGNHL